ncbi:DUF6388 family protein [Erwiniaceae bacterium BAC15a-03b]|uniref:DUF6388 family protein n=1 Tax=Winslowiella arboricola TaxID=2978220 RepID=A0A9J6PP38_9GAMM|nr:DUF6388 family protein [Winslowiella arboricola]MCU5773292.1 DUF6388 family protein [Winslowiella arboricola]MCU5779178.1 DUF6388 family protein [Winslowiella arboricola]
MKTPEEYYTLARAMFLQAHPDFHAAMEKISPQDAQSMGVSLEKLKEIQADRIYAAFLRAKKQDAMLFSIQLAEPDKEVAAQAIEKYLRSHAKALGMSWEEFCIKNEL